MPVKEKPIHIPVTCTLHHRYLFQRKRKQSLGLATCETCTSLSGGRWCHRGADCDTPKPSCLTILTFLMFSSAGLPQKRCLWGQSLLHSAQSPAQIGILLISHSSASQLQENRSFSKGPDQMRHKKLLLLLGKKVIFFNYLVKKSVLKIWSMSFYNPYSFFGYKSTTEYLRYCTPLSETNRDNQSTNTHKRTLIHQQTRHIIAKMRMQIIFLPLNLTQPLCSLVCIKWRMLNRGSNVIHPSYLSKMYISP